MKENLNVSIQARIDRLAAGDGPTKAFASVTIGNAFAVHDIRVIEKDDKVMVNMPFRSYKTKEKTKYVDVFHPITAESRTQLMDAVKDAYEQALEEKMEKLERGDMSQQM